MNNGNGHKARCSRCGAAIRSSENVFQTAAYRETEEGDIEGIGGSVLCFPCAALLLTRSVMEKGPVAPEAAPRKGEIVHIDANDGQIMDILVNEVKGESEVDTARLLVHCGKKGFMLDLECYDGAAWAGSRLFNWRQIAQMLIAAHPDMFGRLDEPEHSVFPENLERLGFSVPKNWRA